MNHKYSGVRHAGCFGPAGSGEKSMRLGVIASFLGCAAAVLAAPAWADVKWTFNFPTVNCASDSCYGNTKNASLVTGSFSIGGTPALTSVTPAGKTSVTVTAEAVLGPALLTLRA